MMTGIKKNNAVWNIQLVFKKIYKMNIQPDYNVALFGSLGTTTGLPSHCKQTLKMSMIAAKTQILKKQTPPCFKRWLNNMVSVARMEQIHFGKRKSQSYYQKIWRPFLATLDEAKICA